MAAIMTVDYEPWFSFHRYSFKWENTCLQIDEPTDYLLDLLKRHKIKAIFYMVGWLSNKRIDLFDKIRHAGHVLGDHTYYHRMPDNELTKRPYLFRAPRWEGEKRLFSGGFWMRAMPYWWLKREVEKTGIFFLHPHDVMLKHPDAGIRTFDRRLGLKTSRDKLERLCREVVWNVPG